MPEAYLSTAELAASAHMSLGQVEGLLGRGVLLARKTGRGTRRNWAAAELDCAKAFHALRHRRRAPVPVIVSFLSQLRAAKTASERRRLIDQAVLLKIRAYPGAEIRTETGPAEAHANAVAAQRGSILSRERLADILAER